MSVRYEGIKSDVIRGYRADDSYFSFAKAFLNNTITVEQLSEAMRLEKLGEQIVLKSEKARAEYRKISGSYDADGIYLIDIIREGIGDGDARLR